MNESPLRPPPFEVGSRRFALVAPKGRFRVVGVDTFEGPFADYLVGDFVERSDAIKEAARRAGDMKPHYVYDDVGTLVFSAGSP